jgi:hypothetical protein
VEWITFHGLQDVEPMLEQSFNIHLRSTVVHHLPYMVQWVLSLIPKSIPKWRATLALVVIKKPWECHFNIKITSKLHLLV